MKGKFFTIIGIVLLFGYFIKDSITPYDPTQVVMVGNDTLGRDWGAIAEQKARQNAQNSADNSAVDAYGYNITTTTPGSNPYMHNMYGADSMTYGSNAYYNNSAQQTSQDPFSRPKFNQDNYSSVESTDGREIIIGYERPEQQENNQQYNNPEKIQTRHQREVGEPKMRYRD